jgi:ribosomal protein S18 acetylase RimI-like enzyme
MSPEIAVRPVRKDELSSVLQLWQEAETAPTLTDSIEELTRMADEPGAVLLVAIADGRVVGSVIGGWDGWRGNIYRLSVLPAFRRKGVAARLAQEISRLLFDKGVQRLSALVEHAHPRAMGFWDSMCWIGYARDPRYARCIVDRVSETIRNTTRS